MQIPSDILPDFKGAGAALFVGACCIITVVIVLVITNAFRRKK